eukprot:ANDGO_07849.mRNA.1 Ubiquitin-like modifier-activating enzyme atg7
MTKLAYDPFRVVFPPSFWIRISELKLNEWRLEDDAKPIYAHYSASSNCRMTVSENAASDTNDPFSVHSSGLIILKNSLPEFQESNCEFELTKLACLLPAESLGRSPVIFAYADLKKHTFHFVATVPAPLAVPDVRITKTIACQSVMSGAAFEELVRVSANLHEFGHTLVAVDSEDPDLSQVLMFIDPSNHAQFPGWPLRGILSTFLRGSNVKKVTVLCARKTVEESFFLVMDVLSIPSDSKQADSFSLGGKVDVRTVDVSSSLNPALVASSACALNLRLMKWRALPSLDLDRLANLKVLILGVGTLGCHVARQCLAWGITNLTLIDYGQVSFSNPVRQSLYSLADVGRPKAAAAAEALGKIHPDAGKNVQHRSLSIPMPGHDLTADPAAVIELDGLIRVSDAVFLLTDSREARWLPTLIASSHNVPLINAALGFDAFMVMRHTPQFGCYFCSDIVAPRDSMTRRTIDQQCTVTRPGASLFASSLAVELAVDALALGNAGGSELEVPTQIRGSLDGYTQDVMKSCQSPYCVACSSSMLDAYRNLGSSWVCEMIKSPAKIEQLSGLSQLLESKILESVSLHNSDDGAIATWDIDDDEVDGEDSGF